MWRLLLKNRKEQKYANVLGGGGRKQLQQMREEILEYERLNGKRDITARRAYNTKVKYGM